MYSLFIAATCRAAKPLIYATLLFAIVFGVFFVALRYNLFLFYPQLDIPFHIAGGTLAATCAFTLIRFFNISLSTTLKHWSILLGLTLVIGISWELIEYGLDLYFKAHWLGSPTDTIGDIINDLIGGSLVAWGLKK